MRTHSRWSRDARIWEFRRRSWTTVCLNSGPVFKERPTNAEVASTQSHRLFNENANQVKEGDSQTNPWTNTRAKVFKWKVSVAAFARVTEKRLKRVSKSDNMFDGCRRDVDKRI